MPSSLITLGRLLKLFDQFRSKFETYHSAELSKVFEKSTRKYFLSEDYIQSCSPAIRVQQNGMSQAFRSFWTAAVGETAKSPEPSTPSPPASPPSDEAKSQESPPLTPQVKPLELRGHQGDHFKKIMDILNRFYFYIDGSGMGRGKTYAAAALAISRRLPLLVICPKKVRQNWLDVMTEYGVPFYDLPGLGGVISYDKLRSQKGCQPAHKLLTREDTSEGVNFYPTATWAGILQAGVLLIFDESQKLKNTSDQYRAAKALVKQLYHQGGTSRIGFLSGTIMDKPEQAVNFFRTVGFIESRNLYTKPRNGEVRLEGVRELQTWGFRVNPQKAREYIDSHIFRSTKEGSVQYVFDFWVDVIRPAVMSIMPGPAYETDIKNGYYRLEPEDEIEYRKAITSLARAVRYNHKSATVVLTKETMSAVTPSLRKIQNAKMRAMARVAREYLETPQFDEQGRKLCPKLTLFCDYYETIDYLLEALKEYNPGEIAGRTPDNKFHANIASYQEPNSNCRLLIGNPLTGGLGINLHDTTGLFPRAIFIMPDYRVMDKHQAAYRIYRDGFVGKAKVRFFYGLSGSRENTILGAWTRKGEVMKKVHQEQGAKFPNEYESEFEAPPEKVNWEDPALADPQENPDDIQRMIAASLEKINLAVLNQ